MSRIPTVVSTSASIFTFPFAFMVAVLIQSVIGTWLTLISISATLVAFVAMMKPGNLAADSHEELHLRNARHSKVTYACIAVAVVLFGVAFVLSDLTWAAYELLKENDIDVTHDQLRAFRNKATWVCVNMVATFFGKSLISTVFFADGAVTLTYRFYTGEANDSFAKQCSRDRLVKDIESLDEGRPKLNRLNQVMPEPEEGSGGANTIMGQLAEIKSLMAVLNAAEEKIIETSAYLTTSAADDPGANGDRTAVQDVALAAQKRLLGWTARNLAKSSPV